MHDPSQVKFMYSVKEGSRLFDCHLWGSDLFSPLISSTYLSVNCLCMLGSLSRLTIHLHVVVHSICFLKYYVSTYKLQEN